MKKKFLKVELVGPEESVIISKCPANGDDVMSALHFLDELSELRCTIVECEIDEKTGQPIINS